MENRFCCYGTYNPKNERCLIKCPDGFECKMNKYKDDLIKETKEEQNEQNNEG